MFYLFRKEQDESFSNFTGCIFMITRINIEIQSLIWRRDPYDGVWLLIANHRALKASACWYKIVRQKVTRKLWINWFKCSGELSKLSEWFWRHCACHYEFSEPRCSGCSFFFSKMQFLHVYSTCNINFMNIVWRRWFVLLSIHESCVLRCCSQRVGILPSKFIIATV